jgi:hypothetical protein
MRPEKPMVAAITAALMLSSGSAWAHQPIETEADLGTWQEAKEIEHPDVSQVIYRELDPAEPAVWLSFPVLAGQEIYFSLGVPKIARLEGFRPYIAVVGLGFPAAELPVELPPGAGALILEPSGTPKAFYEPFTGTDSLILLAQTVRFDTAGTYRVVAYVPEPLPPGAKLWVAIGDKEQWGFGDLLRMPAIIDEVRAFHEVPPFPWWIPVSVGSAAVLFGGVVICFGIASLL